MYDELIAELRRHHCDAKEDDTQEVCEECAYDVIIADKSVPSGIASVCACGLMNRAADAIEELGKLNAEITRRELKLRMSKPRWIPVTERLPEKKKAHYLCLLDDDSMAVVYWSKVPDWASKGEWTWHNPNWKEVTHWMPLPRPPKAEEGE